MKKVFIFILAMMMTASICTTQLLKAKAEEVEDDGKSYISTTTLAVSWMTNKLSTGSTDTDEVDGKILQCIGDISICPNSSDKTIVCTIDNDSTTKVEFSGNGSSYDKLTKLNTTTKLHTYYIIHVSETSTEIKVNFETLSNTYYTMQYGTYCTGKIYEIGDTIVVDKNRKTPLTKEGYTQIGWNTTENATEALESFELKDTDISILNNTTAVIMMYPVWKENSECYLDLDATTTTILDNKEIEQKYNLEVKEGSEEGYTKVKLSWEITDIEATRTDNKKWDTTELKWVDDSTSKIDTAGKAVFTLENYSSEKVDVTCEFEAVDDEGVKVEFDATTGSDGKITLDTVNGSETYSKTNLPKGEITVTVTPSDTYFNSKDKGDGVKYGVYTITITKAEEEKD